METKELVTTDDYFAPMGYGDSVCGILCQDRINELSEAFDEFLSDIRCKRTPDSEWYYSSQHSGIHATWDAWELIYFEPDEAEWKGELITKPVYDAWNDRVPRMRAIKEWLDRHEYHLQDAPFEWYGDFIKRRHRRDERRWDVMVEAYENAIDEALEEVCHEYEKLLESECDYYYSDEGAEDWVRFQNEEV